MYSLNTSFERLALWLVLPWVLLSCADKKEDQAAYPVDLDGLDLAAPSYLKKHPCQSAAAASPPSCPISGHLPALSYTAGAHDDDGSC